jgi:hypothetical protein
MAKRRKRKAKRSSSSSCMTACKRACRASGGSSRKKGRKSSKRKRRPLPISGKGLAKRNKVRKRAGLPPLTAAEASERRKRRLQNERASDPYYDDRRALERDIRRKGSSGTPDFNDCFDAAMMGGGSESFRRRCEQAYPQL